MDKKIPQYVKPCLWYLDAGDLDLEENREEIITQVLNYGTWKAVSWVIKTYGRGAVKEVIKNPRRGVWFPDVLNFWGVVLKIKVPESLRKKAIFSLNPKIEA